MGFSLELFFQELQEIVSRDQKASKTIKQLKRLIDANEAYARECGQLTNNKEQRMNIKNLTTALIIFVFVQLYSVVIFDLDLTPIQGFVLTLTVTIEILIAFVLTTELNVFTEDSDNKEQRNGLQTAIRVNGQKNRHTNKTKSLSSKRF